MIFFHASLDLDVIDEFVPRIPSKKVMVENEDVLTPRICLCRTIKGCLTAAPWGGNSFEELFFDGEISQLIRIYEFESDDISKENIISSSELYKLDKVRDAEVSEEVWVVGQNLKPKSTYLIEITEYVEGVADNIKYEDLINLNEEEGLDSIIDGFFTTINQIEYSMVPENKYNDRFLFNYKIKASSGYNEDSIYDAIDCFLSEHWTDYSIDIRNENEDEIYSIELLVDLSDKPTTEKNFTNILFNDIGINQAISKIA